MVTLSITAQSRQIVLYLSSDANSSSLIVTHRRAYTYTHQSENIVCLQTAKRWRNRNGKIYQFLFPSEFHTLPCLNTQKCTHLCTWRSTSVPFPPRGKTGRDHKGFVREKGDKKNSCKKRSAFCGCVCGWARVSASSFLHASQRRWGIFSSSVSNRSSKERQWPVRLCQLKDVFSCEQYQAVSLTPWWPR